MKILGLWNWAVGPAASAKSTRGGIPEASDRQMGVGTSGRAKADLCPGNCVWPKSCSARSRARGELRLSAASELFAWDCRGHCARQFGWGSEDEHQYFSRAPPGRGRCAADADLRHAVARMVREPVGVGHERQAAASSRTHQDNSPRSGTPTPIHLSTFDAATGIAFDDSHNLWAVIDGDEVVRFTYRATQEPGTRSEPDARGDHQKYVCVQTSLWL